MSVTLYNALISACAKRGDLQRAEFWLNRMVTHSLGADVVSYSTVINACAKCNDLRGAEAWFKKMGQEGVQACDPTARARPPIVGRNFLRPLETTRRAGEVSANPRRRQQVVLRRGRGAIHAETCMLEHRGPFVVGRRGGTLLQSWDQRNGDSVMPMGRVPMHWCPCRIKLCGSTQGAGVQTMAWGNNFENSNTM